MLDLKSPPVHRNREVLCSLWAREHPREKVEVGLSMSSYFSQIYQQDNLLYIPVEERVIVERGQALEERLP